MRFSAAFAISLFALAQSVHAQTIYETALPPAAAASGTRNYYLPLGTPVQLRTVTQISSRDNKPGDRVYLEVAENVTFRGQTVIPAGTPALGEVSELQRNGHLGKKGEVGLRLIAIDTSNGSVRIGGNIRGQGNDQTALSVGTIVFVSMLGGFLIHGTSAIILPGTPVDGQLLGNLPFTWYANGDSNRLGDATPAQPDGVNFASNRRM